VSINKTTLLQLYFEESADKCYYKVSQIGAELCELVNKITDNAIKEETINKTNEFIQAF